MGSSAENSSGVHWCRRRVMFNEAPEKVREKTGFRRRFRRRFPKFFFPSGLADEAQWPGPEGEDKLHRKENNNIP